MLLDCHRDRMIGRQVVFGVGTSHTSPIIGTYTDWLRILIDTFSMIITVLVKVYNKISNCLKTMLTWYVKLLYLPQDIEDLHNEHLIESYIVY